MDNSVGDTSDATDILPLGEGLLGSSAVETRSDDDGGPTRLVVKRLERAWAPDLDEFRRHFESLARLEHPHLVAYGELRETDPPIRFEQEYVEGTDFLSYVRRAPTLEELETLRRRFDETLEERSDTDDEDDASEKAADDNDETREADEAGETDGDPGAPDEASEPPPDHASTDRPDDTDPGGLDTIDPWARPDGSSEETESDSSDAARTRRDSSGEHTSAAPGTSASFPDVHTYSESTLGADDSSDVLLDPADDPDFDEVELLDVVFLRLERLIPQLLGALEYLHRFDHPHGGLKPSNVLVDAHGRLALADFGLLGELALVDAPDPDRPDDLEPAGRHQLDHARAYAAPEVRAELEATLESDLYALGCLLFEAITGCRPLDADRESSHDGGEREPGAQRFDLRASALSELEPRCPSAWVDLVLRLLDADPEARPDFEAIRQILSSSRGRSVDIPPSFVPEQQSFFGRDDVFEQLVDAAESCVADESMRLSLLSGRAGYGKTAMAERLAQWAAQRGWVVLRGRCYDGASILYQGLNAIAVQLAEICRGAMGGIDQKTDRLRRRAARLLPALSPEQPDEAPLQRLEAIAALRELLAIVSAERPILVLVDDLNWASPDTADLVADLVADPEHTQCHLVGTWRRIDEEPFDHPLVDALASAPVPVDWIDVRGLRSEEAGEFVDSIAEVPDSLRERILEIGAENPLVIEELIYQLHLERGSEEAEEAADLLFETDADSAADWLTTLLERRLDSLSRREMFLIQLLSVASIPLPGQIISLALEEEFRSGDSGDSSRKLLLDHLRSLRLVRQVEDDAWEEVYTLFHNVSRRLVLDEIHDQHRTHLCEHLADAFRRAWPEAIALRFELLVGADRLDDALDLALRAARRAESRFAYHRAASMWRWLAEQSEEANRKTTMRPVEELARVERRAGHPDRAAALSDDLADGLPDGVARSEHRLHQFETLLEAGRLDDAVDALDDALGAFGESYLESGWFPTLRQWKHRAVAATNRWSDDLDDLRHEPLGGRATLRLKLYRHILLKDDLLDPARASEFRVEFSATAERSKEARLLGYDRLFLALDCHRPGLHRRPARAAEWYEEASRLLERTDDQCGLAHTALGRARMAQNDGEFDRTAEWLDDAEERFARSETLDEREPYLVDFQRARLDRRRGHLDRALHLARKLRHFYRANQLVRFRANQVLIPLQLLQRNLERAAELIDEAEAFLEGTPPTLAETWLARQSSRLNLAYGRPEVARGQLDMLEERLQHSGLADDPVVRNLFFVTRGQALCALLARKSRIGESRRKRLVAQIRRSLRNLRKTTVPRTPALDADVDRLAARFALLAGNLQVAYEHLQSARRHLDDFPDPIARAMGTEARGIVFERQRSGLGSALLEQSRIVYDHHACRFPLVLEGWPIPDDLSSLGDDEHE